MMQWVGLTDTKKQMSDHVVVVATTRCGGWSHNLLCRLVDSNRIRHINTDNIHRWGGGGGCIHLFDLVRILVAIRSDHHIP